MLIRFSVKQFIFFKGASGSESYLLTEYRRDTLLTNYSQPVINAKNIANDDFLLYFIDKRNVSMAVKKAIDNKGLPGIWQQAAPDLAS